MRGFIEDFERYKPEYIILRKCSGLMAKHLILLITLPQIPKAGVFLDNYEESKMITMRLEDYVGDISYTGIDLKHRFFRKKQSDHQP